MEQEHFEACYPKIYKYVRYRVSRQQDAEDITNEVFCKALAGAAFYKAGQASYITWLTTIAHNCIANFYRGKRMVLPIEGLWEEPDTSGHVEEAMLAKEEQRKLFAMLRILPQRDLTILMLRFWGDFSYADIAEYAGVSISNVGNILSRSIAKLRKHW